MSAFLLNGYSVFANMHTYFGAAASSKATCTVVVLNEVVKKLQVQKGHLLAQVPLNSISYSIEQNLALCFANTIT